MRFPEGKEKAVTFSYDDGVRDDIKLIDIINRYGIKCTFNINSGFIGNNTHLTADEVQKHILDNGHEVAVHGEIHRAPSCIRPIEGIRDVLDCRLYLERTFNVIVRGMAYPDSGITREICTLKKDVKNYLKELDIAYSRSLGGDNNSFQLPSDWYEWIPTAHHTNPLIFDYIDEFVKINLSGKYVASRDPKLFYLWGHSYEFVRDNNWSLLESICERLGNKDDIWYATNMEIYNYTEAYKSLNYSADGTMIYNPTLLTIWFDVDGTTYNVAPGETIKLK